MSIRKGHVVLDTLEAWQRYAGPKRADQWVDGRSAKEAARAWLSAGAGCLPDEVAAALLRHPAFGQVLCWDAEPEAKLRFDAFPGETRNTDLRVDAIDGHGPFIMGVEAKADESFADTVPDALAAALERKLCNNASNGVLRIEQLAQAILGCGPAGTPDLRAIRYQLLTACAGVLCEAQRKRYPRALMLVHEFVTPKTSDDRHEQNAADLNAFVARLSGGAVRTVRPGEIHGPFAVPGMPLAPPGVALFIGKVRRDLRTPGRQP